MDADGSGCVDDCVDTEAWTWGGVLEADEDADAGISSRGCKVVGGVKISGAAGGGGGGSENGLGVKEAEAEAGVDDAGMDGSGCIAGVAKNVLDVDGPISRWCNGSPAWWPGRGKLAVLRRPVISSLVMLLGPIDDHGAPISSPFRSTRSRSESVSFKSSTLVEAGYGLDGGGVGAELFRFSEGIWQIGGAVAVADVGMGNGGTLECRVGDSAISSDSERFC